MRNSAGALAPLLAFTDLNLVSNSFCHCTVRLKTEYLIMFCGNTIDIIPIMRVTLILAVTALFVAAELADPDPIVRSQIAVYDPDLGAPRCRSVGPACDSIQILNGVGESERNAPNTIDSCPDSQFNVYYKDESIEHVLLRSLDGELLTMGDQLEFVAIVYRARNTTEREYQDGKHHASVFYASDAYAANWVYKGTRQLLSRWVLAF